MELRINGLTKTYGATIALQGVDLTMSEGIYGLLGPNGAGKSTLMNILTGNLTPTAGVVTFDGIPIQKMGAAYREKLGYMPQQQAMYPAFTVRRFLSYMAALRGMSRADASERIAQVLEQVELTAVSGKRISTLSGGMKQRLLIAQAILADPAVLILDEPTAGLDPKATHCDTQPYCQPGTAQNRDYCHTRSCRCGIHCQGDYPAPSWKCPLLRHTRCHGGRTARKGPWRCGFRRQFWKTLLRSIKWAALQKNQTGSMSVSFRKSRLQVWTGPRYAPIWRMYICGTLPSEWRSI